MTKLEFLIILILISVPVSLPQTEDSILIDLFREIVVNEQFNEEFNKGGCYYDFVIMDENNRELKKIKIDSKISIYIANDSLLRVNHIQKNFELIDFVCLENTARIQLVDKLNNLIFSAFFEKKEDIWKIISTDVRKNKG